MLLSVLLLSATTVRAEDWPQWLGPRRDGTSAETVAPWKTAPKVPWRIAVGEGHSSPVVADGRVFLHTRVMGKDAEAVTAYGVKDGKKLWSKSYPRGEFSSGFGLGPRVTPTVHKGRVYTYGVTGILSCWNASNGEQVWTVDTVKEFKPPALRFGVSGSPVVEGDLLLVPVGAKGASVVAFKLADGKVAWKALDDPPSYASPIVVGEGKTRQAIFLTAKGLCSLNPSDGKLFWQEPFVDLLNESSTTPVKAGDLLLASSVTAGSLCLKLGTKDGKPSVSRLWKSPALSCYFSTPIPVGKGDIYLVTGSVFPPPSSTLRCVELKTGKIRWSQPKVAKYHAALLRTANDKLLMLDDFGNLKLLDPDPKGYKELATAKVCGPTWAHPSLSNGKVLIRDEAELICVDLSAK
jgi:outer membrane protein assembly factor BamB